MSAFARPYARAFLESAPAGYDAGAFLAAAGAVTAAIAANAPLRAFLDTPTVPREAKSRAVAAIAARAGLDAFGARFFQVLLKHRRLLEARDVLAAIADAHDVREGIVRARVTVAAPIAEAEKTLVEEAVAARTGRKVRIQIDQDPAILAGFVARVGSNVYDGSAATEIRRFLEQAKEGTGA